MSNKKTVVASKVQTPVASTPLPAPRLRARVTPTAAVVPPQAKGDVLDPRKGKPVAPVAPPKADAPVAKTPVAKTPVAKTPVAKPPTGTKFVSKDMFLGRHMRVAEFQDYSLSINDKADRRKTDVELCADFQTQFPNAVQFQPFHITGIRRDYNKGIHSKAFSGVHTSLPWVMDEKGIRTQAASVRTAKSTDAPKSVATSTSATSVVGKAVKTVRKAA